MGKIGKLSGIINTKYMACARCQQHLPELCERLNIELIVDRGGAPAAEDEAARRVAHRHERLQTHVVVEPMHTGAPSRHREQDQEAGSPTCHIGRCKHYGTSSRCRRDLQTWIARDIDANWLRSK